MARRGESVARTIVVFVVLGSLVLVAVSVAGFLVIREVATRQALEDAKQLMAVKAQVVQRRVNRGFLSGDAEALGIVDRVVRESVLVDPIVRVKIWSPDGTIVYSDELGLIGQRYDSHADLGGLRSDEVEAEISDLSAPENRSEQSFGRLLEVSTPIEPRQGPPLLFEIYQRTSSVDAAENDILRAFVPVLVVALAAFAVLLLPLAVYLARRLQRSAREREQLLQRAIDSSDQERRRIAGDLHDGPIQDLAGLSMRLSAEAQGASDPEQERSLTDAAGAVRAGVRTLRSAIVGIYPPNLEAAGLGPALSDLTARLPREGLAVTLDVADPSGYGPVVDQLLYRVCREGLRNVERHADASAVAVDVRREGSRAVLEVRDDGQGIDGQGSTGDDDDEHHFGLKIVRDLVADAGGEVRVGAADGRGTVLHVEVPIP